MNNQVAVAQLAEQQDFNPDDFGSRPNSGSTAFIFHWCDWRKPCYVCDRNERNRKMN